MYYTYYTYIYDTHTYHQLGFPIICFCAHQVLPRIPALGEPNKGADMKMLYYTYIRTSEHAKTIFFSRPIGFPLRLVICSFHRALSGTW